MKRLRQILFWVLIFPVIGFADVYKCRLSDGRIEFSDSPCASGNTVTVRRDETISPEQRSQAEREVERMRDYVERRESAREKDAQSSATSPSNAKENPPSRVAIDECLQELERLVLSAGQRSEMETSCRKQGKLASEPSTSATTTVIGNSVTRCIRNVEMANLTPQQREYRILQCQGATHHHRPTPQMIPPQPTPSPAKTEKKTEPAHELCPPGKPHCGKSSSK